MGPIIQPHVGVFNNNQYSICFILYKSFYFFKSNFKQVKKKGRFIFLTWNKYIIKIGLIQNLIKLI